MKYMFTDAMAESGPLSTGRSQGNKIRMLAVEKFGANKWIDDKTLVAFIRTNPWQFTKHPDRWAVFMWWRPQLIEHGLLVCDPVPQTILEMVIDRLEAVRHALIIDDPIDRERLQMLLLDCKHLLKRLKK